MNLVNGIKKVGLGLGLVITILSFQNCKVKYSGVDVTCDDCGWTDQQPDAKYDGDISILRFKRVDTRMGYEGEVNKLELRAQNNGKVLAVLNEGSGCSARGQLKGSKLTELEKLINESEKIVALDYFIGIPERLSETLELQKNYNCEIGPGFSCIALASKNEYYNLNSVFEGTSQEPYLSKAPEISKLLNGIKNALLKRGCETAASQPSEI